MLGLFLADAWTREKYARVFARVASSVETATAENAIAFSQAKEGAAAHAT